MEIQEVDYKEYKKIVNADIIYNTADFNYLNRYKVDRLHFFLFKDHSYKFALCAGQRDDKILCPFSAPFASFVALKKQWHILQLEEAIDCFDEFIKSDNQIKFVRFTLPPYIYDENLIVSMQNILLRKNYSISQEELNFSFNLTNPVNFSFAGRKNLATALRNDLKIRHCENIEDKKIAYDIISQNRQSKGYPLRMTWEQVKETIDLVDHDFFIVSNDEFDIASAVIFQVTDKIAQVIYWGDAPGYSSLRPVNFLAHRLVKYYEESRGGGGQPIWMLDLQQKMAFQITACATSKSVQVAA